MSRARPIILPDGETFWVDTKRNNERATEEQLELLMTVEAVELDDLLDGIELSQGEAIRRLRKALGQDFIPEAVLKRRAQMRNERKAQPTCRMCGRAGDSTKHHFINKWILRELSSYARRWSSRQRNCIPLCIECHRMIHSRSRGVNSIVEMLNDTEKQFAEEALHTLSEEHPKLLILIARGDDSVYESRLVKDWIEGRFVVEERPVTERVLAAL